MEQYDGGDCTPEAPVSESDTTSRVTRWSLSQHAADAIRSLEHYQRIAAAAEKTRTGKEQLAWAYRRRQVEACIRMMQRVEASRTEPDWEPPAQPDWMINPSDEELRRVSRSVTDDELDVLR